VHFGTAGLSPIGECVQTHAVAAAAVIAVAASSNGRQRFVSIPQDQHYPS